MSHDLTAELAAREVTLILSTHGSSSSIAPTDVFVGDDVVTSRLHSTRMSDTLMDVAFPTCPSGRYYHYTKFDCAEKILSTGTFRLYNLHKNLTFDEFVAFCRHHRVSGYLDKPQEAYKELMDDLFYGSLVSDPNDSRGVCWRDFGDNHKGACLKFQVTVHDISCFRKVFYDQRGSLPVLRSLEQWCNSYKKHFIPFHFSVFGAFYLPDRFRDEAENRLLVKRHKGGQQFPFAITSEGAGLVKFVEYNLVAHNCPMFTLKLCRVKVGAKGDKTRMEEHYRKHGRIANVVIE